jgi:cardiolipin synthase A/B
VGYVIEIWAVVGVAFVVWFVVDHTWAVVGTTNIDNRSFEHNDEVNVACRDSAIAGRLLHDFEADLAVSVEITAVEWRGRPVLEKVVEPVCWILE